MEISISHSEVRRRTVGRSENSLDLIVRMQELDVALNQLCCINPSARKENITRFCSNSYDGRSRHYSPKLFF